MKIPTELSQLEAGRRTKVAEEWKSIVKRRLARKALLNSRNEFSYKQRWKNFVQRGEKYSYQRPGKRSM